ncbi:MAG TPA: hypothetical protein ENN73_03210, partial [Firmicutes bacterium]|nr:hypothetical protein [Bacillota bacterium]
AHNDYAQFIVENGIVGFVFLLLLFIWILIKIVINRKRFDIFDLVLLASLIGILIHALVDFSLRVPGVYTVLIVFISILLREKNFEGHKKFGGEKNWTGLIFLVLLLFNIIISIEFIGVKFRIRGNELITKNNYESAQDKLFIATHFNHFDPEAHRMLGICYMELFFKDPSESGYLNTLEEFGYALRYNKISGLIPYNLAIFFQRIYFRKIQAGHEALAERKQAIEFYKQAIRREPTLVLYRYQLAKFYFRINQNKNALSELETAIEIEENYINAHLLKAIVLRNLGNEKAGKEAFDKALEIEKKYLGLDTLNTYDLQLLQVDEELGNYLRKPVE